MTPQATEEKKELKTGFNGLGIAPNLLAILQGHKYLNPTPIQAQAIPVALEGNDVIGIAQTGTGKTLAFGLPMIQRLSFHKGQGLVLVPTRELALQVDETLRKIGHTLRLKTAVVIGGASMGMQVSQLRQNPHIIVATPGRLVDHIKQKTVSLQNVKVAVLDEADRMLDIGFAPQINQILSLLSRDRQTLLFSATMPNEIADMAGKHMKMPLRIEVAPAGTSAAKVTQELFIVGKDMKMQLLDKILTDNPGTVLVFSRTKHGAKKIAAAIRHMNHTAVEMHSNRSLAQRRAALDGFKSGKFRILVATDIAARGIDVTGISLVINYDLPDNPEDYVHRIGRTGRAGNAGKAISFVAPEERGDIRHIERVIRRALPILTLPVLPPRRAPAPMSHAPRRGNPSDRFNYPPRRSGGGHRRFGSRSRQR
ncbi:MAG TPA: DEAD/DEAH box helicase [Candidatus Kapabacteria bacterium]|nr:DEAD/DEAH box helicase [Candidatus Kapabacteria bacterium]